MIFVYAFLAVLLFLALVNLVSEVDWTIQQRRKTNR